MERMEYNRNIVLTTYIPIFLSFNEQDIENIMEMWHKRLGNWNGDDKKIIRGGWMFKIFVMEKETN